MTFRPVGAREHVDRYRIEDGLRHLRGNSALPDQGVEPVEIVVDLSLDIAWRDGGRSRPDRLVSLLGVLRFRLVDTRLLGDLVVAVETAGDLADLADRFPRERHRVRTHVADEADIAFTEIDALVELLREPHRAPGVEAELAR